MLCEKYGALTVIEKITLIGQLQHCMQSDDIFFDAAQVLVNNAKDKGLLDNVIILPVRPENY